MPTFRTARILLENETSKTFTIVGFGALTGDWKHEPEQGLDIPPQSNAEWMLISELEGEGAGGFIRFAAQDTHFFISCETPWVGPFKQEVTGTHDLEFEARVNDYTPQIPLLMVTVSSKNE